LFVTPVAIEPRGESSQLADITRAVVRRNVDQPEKSKNKGENQPKTLVLLPPYCCVLFLGAGKKT